MHQNHASPFAGDFPLQTHSGIAGLPQWESVLSALIAEEIAFASAFGSQGNHASNWGLKIANFFARAQRIGAILVQSEAWSLPQFTFTRLSVIEAGRSMQCSCKQEACMAQRFYQVLPVDATLPTQGSQRREVQSRVGISCRGKLGGSAHEEARQNLTKKKPHGQQLPTPLTSILLLSALEIPVVLSGDLARNSFRRVSKKGFQGAILERFRTLCLPFSRWAVWGCSLRGPSTGLVISLSKHCHSKVAAGLNAMPAGVAL